LTIKFIFAIHFRDIIFPVGYIQKIQSAKSPETAPMKKHPPVTGFNFKPAQINLLQGWMLRFHSMILPNNGYRKEPFSLGAEWLTMAY
jgi:hypothetical protein